MFIRSERLFLRPVWPEDRDELLARIGHEEVVRNLATAPWPYTAEEAGEFLARPREEMLPQFFITLPCDLGTRLIGGIGLGRDRDDVELGYWIAREHWGQGYASEAACAVVGLAATLGHARIVASHFTDNAASGRVLRRAGFRPTGERRIRYSAGRQGVAMAECYAVALGANCDAADPVPAMRAA